MTDNIGYGVKAISAERKRQIEEEGWTPEHDDQSRNGEMLAAAICYMVALTRADPVPELWPWDARWWKPKSRRENLIRAGALVAAELDRLKRSRAE